MVLGAPDTVAAHGTLDAAGVDIEEAVLLGWADGRTASLFCSLRCATPGQMRVYGTEGWIDVPPRFHHPDTFVLHRAGRGPQEVTLPHTGGGYAHELREVTDCILAGRKESAVMPLADTVAVQDVMGEVADRLGMHPQEGPAEL
jgi:predicted dehydrogenase